MSKLNLKELQKEYMINENDDDTMVNIKESITRLTDVEQKIFYTYCELGSYAAVAREYNVSAPTAKAYLLEIKNKLFKLMDDDN